MTATEEVDWDPVRNLAREVEQGKPFALTNEVIAILRRAGRQVAISEADIEQSLMNHVSAIELLREIKRRIDDSGPLMRALLRMYTLRNAGEIERARQQMRDVLAVEVVPHRRRIAQSQLEQLDSWKGSKKKVPRKAPTKQVRAKATTKATPSKATTRRKATKKTPSRPPRRKP